MAIRYDVYMREKGDDWESQGSTFETEWDVSAYLFSYYTMYEWRVDTYDTNTGITTTGDTWTFIVTQSGRFPSERRSDYPGIVAADKGWDEENEAWSSEAEFTEIAGGRNKTRAIIIARGKIYFEDY